MHDLSLHALDIAQNSIVAGATDIRISLVQDPESGTLTIALTDNGKGMDSDMLAAVTSPFTTSRTTRKVGLGIPLFKMAAEQTGGTLTIKSAPGVGTELTAVFMYGHIDCPPVGDMGGTMAALIGQCDAIHFVYERRIGKNGYTLDTDELRDILGDVPLSDPEVLAFITEYITEHENELGG